MQQIKMLSVNVGVPRSITVAERAIDTGFCKEAVVGPVSIGLSGIIGDHVADLSRYGGEDQALYLFSNEDYGWWTTELGQDVGPGSFGENITIDRWWSQPRIGDRIHFCNLAIEITFPRIPCATLAAPIARRARTVIEAWLAQGSTGGGASQETPTR